MDRFPRHPRRVHARTRARLFREQPPRRASAHRAYAIENPGGWKGYGADVWGLTASDGPIDAKIAIDGRLRKFQSYAPRGVGREYMLDDGTIAPTAAAASIAFAPEIAIPAIVAMHERYGKAIYGRYGFLDAFNPTLRANRCEAEGRTHGRGRGLVDDDYLGIDQGPILLMIENHRSGLVWKTMRRNPHIRLGLQRAGFEGGWLDARRNETRRAVRAGLRAAARPARGRQVPQREVVRFWAMGREAEVVGGLIDEFERENPGIAVDVQQVPWTAAHEKLLTAYAADELPDIFQLRQHMGAGVRDARRAGAAAAARRRFARGGTGRLLPGIWDTNVIDGRLVGVPWYVDTRLLFYRRDLLQRRDSTIRRAHGRNGNGRWPRSRPKPGRALRDHAAAQRVRATAVARAAAG